MIRLMMIAAMLSAGGYAFGQDSGGWEAPAKLVTKKGKRGMNFDESNIPPYALPDLMKTLDGKTVSTAEEWTTIRRPEIVETFKREMYGRAPLERPEAMTFDVWDNEAKALDDKATRKQVRIHLNGEKDGPGMDLLVYLPNKVERPVPLFLVIGFRGNHFFHADPAIRVGHGGAKGRGTRSTRYPIEQILERGYGFASFCYKDVAPDHKEGFKSGVYPAFDKPGGRPGDAWTAITAWAWAASRALDYFEGDRDVDHKRVGVLGLSRLGKTSLWAGVRDERFAMAVVTCSGSGGAALSSRRFGQTIGDLNRKFGHWTNANFKKYTDKESELTFDQHMLVAAMAPRLVYVSSADTDVWADPRGEFLSCVHGSPIYEFLGHKGLGTKAMPPLDHPINKGRIGYHVRTGGHSINMYDWQCYMDFADRYLK